jgi:hypothetical protein
MRHFVQFNVINRLTFTMSTDYAASTLHPPTLLCNGGAGRKVFERNLAPRVSRSQRGWGELSGGLEQAEYVDNYISRRALAGDALLLPLPNLDSTSRKQENVMPLSTNIRRRNAMVGAAAIVLSTISQRASADGKCTPSGLEAHARDMADAARSASLPEGTFSESSEARSQRRNLRMWNVEVAEGLESRETEAVRQAYDAYSGMLSSCNACWLL